MKDRSTLLLISTIMGIITIVVIVLLISQYQNGATITHLVREISPVASLGEELDCKVSTVINNGDYHSFFMPSPYCFTLEVGERINLSDVPYSKYSSR